MLHIKLMVIKTNNVLYQNLSRIFDSLEIVEKNKILWIFHTSVVRYSGIQILLEILFQLQSLFSNLKI